MCDCHLTIHFTGKRQSPTYLRSITEAQLFFFFFLATLLDQHIQPQHIHRMELTRDEDKKKKITTKAGRARSYCMCGTKQKAPCTVQKEGERRKHQNTAAKKPDYPVCMYVCAYE